MDGKRKYIAAITIIVWSIFGAIYVFYIQPQPLLKHRISYSRTPLSETHIAIIGASGYIGSRLFHGLQQEMDWNIVGYDRIFPGQASYEISTPALRSFHVVIYLGGLTGRVMCQERPNDVDKENVQDIYNLAKRMLSSQLLIFASTSAIAEGSGSRMIDENSPVQSQLFDSYTASLFRRENTLRSFSLKSESAPQMIGLRFGTVIGLSESQRIDLSHMALVCQAFLNGKMRVTHPESNRAFLCMEDLVRAVTTLIKYSKKANRFDIFHLQTFSANIANIANTIAFRTGAYINVLSHPPKDDSVGFALNASKFRTTFDFVFQGSQDKTLMKMMEDIPRMCLGRKSRVHNHSVPCVVCGSQEMHSVLDLHTQPLANDFRNTKVDSLKCERFPLHLVRCPKCYHTQLSYIVDRGYLFSHYLYQSGTSQSLKAHFDQLAVKIINETGKANGTVLELACNDGSQLNQFLKRGWKTFGVDPAKNLAELARKQGHTIYTGFWGVDSFPLLPSPDDLDAIVAQNVFAHVEKPLEFLRACVAVMSIRTKLYIQTSQCEMYETGQFDTVYHEHISFFTAHSFKKIAELGGLRIINFEIVPIHGRSCLVTFQRKKTSDMSFETVLQKGDLPPLALAIEKEGKLGVTEPWFYVKYEAEAQAMRQWILHQLKTLRNQDHTIVAYGAAAKGMVLLHFLLESSDRTWNISYVIDDASLKQNTYCPGTSIPVLPTSTLKKHDRSKSLTIIIFAWNFWEEISNRIRKETVDVGIENVSIIVPFPQQKLIKLEKNTSLTLAQNTYKPLPWPYVFPYVRRQVVLISHFYNEEFLLPYWIRHHAPMFDMAILINYNSTDRSLEIIRTEAPPTWKVVASENMQLDAELVDTEVQKYEQRYPSAWKITLNTPEFLVHPNLRQALADVEHSDLKAYRFRSIIMSGNDSISLQRFTSLLKQRSQYICNEGDHDETEYSRYIHRYSHAVYSVGRHSIVKSIWEWFPHGFLAKYQFADGLDVQHDVDAEQLVRNKESIQQQRQCDLRQHTAKNDELKMIHRVWREVVDH